MSPHAVSPSVFSVALPTARLCHKLACARSSPSFTRAWPLTDHRLLWGGVSCSGPARALLGSDIYHLHTVLIACGLPDAKVTAWSHASGGLAHDLTCAHLPLLIRTVTLCHPHGTWPRAHCGDPCCHSQAMHPPPSTAIVLSHTRGCLSIAPNDF